MGICVSSFGLLTMQLWILTYKFVWVFISPVYYLGVELLCHVVTLCFTLWGITKQPCKVAAPFSFPANSVRAPNSLQLHFILAIIVRVKWSLTVVSMCESLKTEKQLFVWLGPLGYVCTVSTQTSRSVQIRLSYEFCRWPGQKSLTRHVICNIVSHSVWSSHFLSNDV